MISVGAIASNLSTDAIERILNRYPNMDALALTKLDEAPLSLSTFSLLSLRGPGIAYLASTSHLVKGLMQPDSEMLESVIHASLVGSDAEQLN
jgi:flagellar biosynthesis GTPase FlhF